MAAQHFWSLEENLTHGDSSDLNVLGEENIKTFDERDQLAICAGVTIEPKLSTLELYILISVKRGHSSSPT